MNIETFLEELKITERSYNIIIDFFRSQQYLKNVWLHGSRLYDKEHTGSDLDLLVECPQDKYEEFINKLEEMFMTSNIKKINFYGTCLSDPGYKSLGYAVNYHRQSRWLYIRPKGPVTASSKLRLQHISLIIRHHSSGQNFLGYVYTF